MIVLPAIDLRDGKVVRLQEGDYARQTQYSTDPAAIAVAMAHLPSPGLGSSPGTSGVAI